ncbi:aspartate/glutamate racemase family protein [Nocardioides sp.]|uniref:aspartate/glutamate racemase family protein n=1 Tax=Nocardioides sp. TaxID=35761 RepID=UPI0025F8A8D7|nr:aspartate/glutamate racemase family protein [Nocardioides sp.]
MTQTTRTIAMINSDGKSAPVAADPPGVITRLYELRLRVLARTPYEHLFTEIGTLEAAERALADGCDVVYVDTFGDYAVERIRALTPRPVVGAGAASIQHAAAEHASYSIVTVWPASMGYLYDERLSTTPGGRSCRGLHHLSEDDELDRVGRSDGVKARMGRREDQVVESLAALCRSALERDRSEAVLLGCTCMSPVAAALRDRLGVPVLDPSAIGLAAAQEAATDPTPPRSRTGAVRHSGLAGDVVEAYLVAQQQESMWIDDCGVCAITPTVN